MSTHAEKLRKFAVELYKIDAIKFGEYKTKVGLLTPVYCDLRIIVSYPKLLDTLADLIVEQTRNLPLDTICGVPYTALPIATAVSLKTNHPMVMRRKEVKDYGTKKLIEGAYQEGDRCLIIEDVVTSGSSILETVRDLKSSGIKTTDAIVLLNREQGGEGILNENGIKMHALLTMTQLLKILKEENLINSETCVKVNEYLAENQVTKDLLKENNVNRLKMSYLERSKLSKNQIATSLFKIMSEKETNLCVAADLTKTADILNLSECVGPHICLLKLHVDIIEDFNENFIKRLQEIAVSHNFILFEDRKFADIGKTVELQYTKGIYKISSWAKVVTAHSVMGKGTLDAISRCVSSENRGVFLLAQSSTAGFITDEYTKNTVGLVKDYADIITGFVCQCPIFLEQPGFIQLTPGVQLESSVDNIDQTYNTPECVILEKGADIAVVGRGVTTASNPATSAEKYKRLLWQAYEKRILKD